MELKDECKHAAAVQGPKGVAALHQTFCNAAAPPCAAAALPFCDRIGLAKGAGRTGSTE
jgi:hypothetical protein